MFHSLKAKLMLAFGALVVTLFVILGLFLLNAKVQELSADIADNSQMFAEFTSEPVLENYRLYLEPGNFLPFSREMSGFMRQSESISNLSIVSYSGVILYDWAQEQQERYTGVIRTADAELLARIQGNKNSVLLFDGRVVYSLVDDERNVRYVDFNEETLEKPAPTDRILNIVVPVDNSNAVIFEVSYDSLDARILDARKQIGLIAGLGVLLTLMLAYMFSVSITRPLKELEQGALQIAAGRFDVRVPVRTRDEVGVLSSTFNKMAGDLAASVEAKLYKERVTRELELAAKMQADLLPKDKLVLPTLDLAGGLLPATEIGGDAFDYIPMENGKYLVYLGDGTGHGVPAGLMSSISNALLYAFRRESDIKVIAAHLNEVIQEKSSSTMFITMALTIWDEKLSQLTYLNAGHLPILFYEAASNKLTEIKLSGIAFGMVEDIVPRLQEMNLTLSSNDAVILYSDGIPEAQNEMGEGYGMIRLKRIVQDSANDLLTAEGIKNAVLADVTEFRGKREHLDDMTVVVLRRK